MKPIQIHKDMTALYIPYTAQSQNDFVSAIPNGGAKSFTLEEMQAYVEGYIQFVSFGVKGVVLVVNEEGRLKDLPLNPFASYLMKQAICGNVLICPMRLTGEEDDE